MLVVLTYILVGCNCVNNLCYGDHYTVYLTHHKILPYAT